jgi:cytidylate kinase
MSVPRTVAVEGPAASGKSTIGRLLAREWGYLFVDSGMFYRLIAREALRAGVAPEDEEAVTRIARGLRIEVAGDAGSTRLVAGGEAVDEASLRAAEVDRTVPVIARYPDVRAQVRKVQKSLAAGGRIVMAGRDIGTVVLPDAELKVFLEVSAEERARRRALEIERSGTPASFEEILAGIRRRDDLDATREHSPMKAAPDAVFIQADRLTPAEIVASILKRLA